MSKYLKTIGILELICWVICFVALLTKISQMTPWVAALCIILMLLLGPATGLLFIHCGQNEENIVFLQNQINSLEHQLYDLKAKDNNSHEDKIYDGTFKLGNDIKKDCGKKSDGLSFDEFIFRIKKQLENMDYSEHWIAKAVNENNNLLDDWYHTDKTIEDAVNALIMITD